MKNKPKAKKIEINLKFIEKSFSNCIQYELVAYHLKDLLEKAIVASNVNPNDIDTKGFFKWNFLFLLCL